MDDDFDGSILDRSCVDSEDVVEYLTNMADFLSCIVILSSSSCTSPRAVIPPIVELPVPLFVGYVDGVYVSLQPNVPPPLCSCETPPCTCELANTENEDMVVEASSSTRTSICRCGENKKTVINY